MRQQEGYGEGSPPREWRDRWRASMPDGWSASGRVKRRYVYGATEKECARKFRDLKRELWADDNARAVNPRKTVKQWIDDWLDDLKLHARPRTFASDSGLARKWIVPTLGARKLIDLTARDMRKLEAATRAGGLGQTSTHYVAALLRRILIAAKAEGYKVPDSILVARMPAPGESDRTAIPVDDAMQLLSAAMMPESWPPPPELDQLPYGAVKKLPPSAMVERKRIRRARMAWRRAADTDPSRWVAALLQGLRSGEARGLTWDRVDFDSKTITIDRQLQEFPVGSTPPGISVVHLESSYHLTPVKTRAGDRVVPLVPWMVHALKKWRDIQQPSPYGLVWPRLSGSPMSQPDELSAWKALQAVVGVEHPSGRPFVLHEARHTTVSLLLAADVPPPVVIAIVGHSTFSSSQPYSHTDMAAAREALAKVSDRLGLELES
ncbi:site-specific integrase [Propionibacterium freudenreichii]|nr:site-specific integrase [Propionibacterium freudenreichii]